MSSQKIAVKRNVRTRKEESHWDIAQTEFQIPKDFTPRITLEWDDVVPLFKSVLEGIFNATFSDDLLFQDFFDIRPALPNIIKPTTLPGSSIDVLFVLNSAKFPIVFDLKTNSGKKLRSNEELIHSRTISTFAETFNTGMALAKSDPNFDKWNLIDDTLREGIQQYSFQTKLFQYNIFPCIKTVTGSYLLLVYGGEDKSRCLIWIEDNRLQRVNEKYFGLFELIKFCKVILHDWNANNPNHFISPFVFETIAYGIHEEIAVSVWNDSSKQTFESLFNLFMERFKLKLNSGNIPSLSSAEINLIAKLPAEIIPQVIRWVDSIPTYNSTPSLLDLAKNTWERLASGDGGALNIPQLVHSSSPNNANPPQIVRAVNVCSDNNNISDNNNAATNNNGTSNQHILSRRFSDVVTKEDQWNHLCLILDTTKGRGWRDLGSELGKTAMQLDGIENDAVYQKTKPAKILLREWQCSSGATMGALLNALKAVDNHTAFEFVKSILYQ